MNSTSCHPERSLAKSEANRQTQSKDPVPLAANTGLEGIFRVVIRFFDEKDAEQRPLDAAQCESPARQCRLQVNVKGAPEPAPKKDQAKRDEAGTRQ
jgi:hypothetical protein